MKENCLHVNLVKQTGPMDGGINSKRYVCKECGESFRAEPMEIVVREDSQP